MDTNNAPSPALPPEIEQRISAYQPTAIPATDWETCSPSVIALVRACPPADPSDARDLLTTSVHFLAAMQPATGSWDLAAVLSPGTIERFKQRWLHAGAPVNTLRNHLARLHRLERASRGESGARRTRTPKAPPARGTTIYTSSEMSALHQAALRAPVDVAGPLINALRLANQGVVVPDAHGHGLDRDGWHRARSWISEQQLPVLDARRLRRTWALRQATTTSLLEMVRAGVTREELNGLLPHLEASEHQPHAS